MERIMVNGPWAWKQVSTDQYQQIFSRSERDEISDIAVLTGIPEDKLMMLEDQSSIVAILEMISFTNLPIEATVPKHIMVEDELYPMPKSAKLFAFGQSVYLRNKMAGKSFNECVSIMYASVGQRVRDGYFDIAKTEEFELQVRNYPITQTYPVSFFIYSKLTMSGRRSVRLWSLLTRTSTKSIPKLLSLLATKLLKGTTTSTSLTTMQLSLALSLTGCLLT